jgi:hypothetical protein
VCMLHVISVSSAWEEHRVPLTVAPKARQQRTVFDPRRTLSPATLHPMSVLPQLSAMSTNALADDGPTPGPPADPGGNEAEILGGHRARLFLAWGGVADRLVVLADVDGDRSDDDRSRPEDEGDPVDDDGDDDDDDDDGDDDDDDDDGEDGEDGDVGQSHDGQSDDGDQSRSGDVDSQPGDNDHRPEEDAAPAGAAILHLLRAGPGVMQQGPIMRTKQIARRRRTQQGCCP